MQTCSNLELRLASAIISCCSLMILYQAAPVYIISSMIAFLFLWIAYTEWSRFFPSHSWKYWLYGAAYLGIPCVALIGLNHLPQRYLLTLVCLLTFSNDGAAYIFGKCWGKKKLCPSISPQKTWVGLLGGYVISWLVLCFYASATIKQHFFALTFLSVVISTLAVAGDLFESWLKRRARLKDSGSFLPGHGGALDRIDSLLPTSIFFYTAHEWIATLLS